MFKPKERLRRLGAVAVLAIIGYVIWQYNPWRLHRPISESDVAKVELQGKGSTARVPAPESEARQIIRWFNAAGKIRDNSHHGAPGCGDFNYVYITLKSGEQIHISSYDRVTRYKDPKDPDYTDYYFSQPDLHQYLSTLEQRLSSPAATGC